MCVDLAAFANQSAVQVQVRVLLGTGCGAGGWGGVVGDWVGVVLSGAVLSGAVLSGAVPCHALPCHNTWGGLSPKHARTTKQSLDIVFWF